MPRFVAILRTALLATTAGLMALLSCGVASSASAEDKLIRFVAPQGNDSWTGKVAEPNVEKTDGPWQTLEHARDELRKLRAANQGALPAAAEIRLRAGVYALAQPFTLTPEDSGTKERPVSFVAAEAQPPVLSGGKTLRGFHEETVNGKKSWSIDVPEVKDGKWVPHACWINGRRAVRARHPNDGWLKIESLPAEQVTAKYNEGQTRFVYKAGDVPNIAKTEDVNVVVAHFWVTGRYGLKQLEPESRTIHLTAKSGRRLSETGDQKTLARYWLENAIEFLDAPGEWFLDRPAGKLYYLPHDGEKLASATAVLPVLEQVMLIQGDPANNKFVRYVNFQGLEFAHTNWWPKPTHPADAQAAATATAAVQAEGLHDSQFTACRVAHTTAYALHLTGGCQHNKISKCTMHDLGAGGARIGEMKIRAEANWQTQENEVSDCEIGDGGHDFGAGIGVWVGHSPKNLIAHNHIHDFYYTGISLGWTWGYMNSPASDNIVEYNHVHDLGKSLLSDMGGIYTVGARPGTIIRYNVFHDIAAQAYGGWGIYYDEGSTGVVAENNLVYNTTHGGFHQHFGKENVFRNNIIVDGRDAQIRVTRVEPHRSYTFERNVVVYHQGKLLDGNYDKADVAQDHNLFWKVGGEVLFNNLKLADWQAKGRDQHSLVADPKFVAPDKHNYQLAPDSPAKQVGFVPFDVSTAGPRK